MGDYTEFGIHKVGKLVKSMALAQCLRKLLKLVRSPLVSPRFPAPKPPTAQGFKGVIIQARGRSRPWALVLWVASLTGSCTAAHPQPPQGQPIFLWQVQPAPEPDSAPTFTLNPFAKPSVPDRQVYLLGSIHLLKAEDYPLPEPMEAAFATAETLVFEVDPAQLTSITAQMTLLAAAQPEAGETLRTITPAIYGLAQQRAKELGLPLILFNDLEPWFFAFTVVPLKLMTLGFEAQYGIDLHFFKAAQNTDKTIESLESLDDQLNLFDNLSLGDQEAFLRQTLGELDSLETDMETVVGAWKEGDGAALERFLLGSFEAYPQLHDRLLSQRNQQWLPQIEGYVGQDQDYLVIVGAAHLLGEEGLVQLLRDRGYGVTQVQVAPDLDSRTQGLMGR